MIHNTQSEIEYFQLDFQLQSQQLEQLLLPWLVQQHFFELQLLSPFVV
jgi:hypothetical protein